MEIILIVIVVFVLIFFLGLRPVEKIVITKEINNYVMGQNINQKISYRSNFMFSSFKIFAAKNSIKIIEESNKVIIFTYLLKDNRKIKVEVINEKWLGHENAKVNTSNM